MTYTLVTAPAIEPVTLAEARAHLRVDGTDDDALIAGLVASARLEVEAMTGRALVSQTWRLDRPDFPAEALLLPRPPLLSVTSIVYVDRQGATVTLAPAAYTVTAPSGPWAQHGAVLPVYGTAWPSARGGANDVRVTFVAGYGDPAAVPQAIRQALLLLVGDLYENREAQAERALSENLAATRLLAPYRAAWWE